MTRLSRADRRTLDAPSERTRDLACEMRLNYHWSLSTTCKLPNAADRQGSLKFEKHLDSLVSCVRFPDHILIQSGRQFRRIRSVNLESFRGSRPHHLIGKFGPPKVRHTQPWATRPRGKHSQPISRRNDRVDDKTQPCQSTIRNTQAPLVHIPQHESSLGSLVGLLA